MAEETEPALRANLGIEQSNGAGSYIASILEFRVAGLDSLFVERNLVRVRHVDFAAHLEHFRNGTLEQALRQSSQGSNIVGDIVTDFAVASRDSLNEQTLLIANGNCNAIDLEFDNPFNGFAWEQFFNSGKEVAKLLFGVSVLDG